MGKHKSSKFTIREETGVWTTKNAKHTVVRKGGLRRQHFSYTGDDGKKYTAVAEDPTGYEVKRLGGKLVVIVRKLIVGKPKFSFFTGESKKSKIVWGFVKDGRLIKVPTTSSGKIKMGLFRRTEKQCIKDLDLQKIRVEVA